MLLRNFPGSLIRVTTNVNRTLNNIECKSNTTPTSLVILLRETNLRCEHELLGRYITFNLNLASMSIFHNFSRLCAIHFFTAKAVMAAFAPFLAP